MSAPASESIASVPALEMIDVTVSTLHDGSAVALEGVRWTVASGDYWAVGGLHRSGKSDLMAVAAGLTLPARGTLRVFGQELTVGYEHESAAARRPVGLVFDGGQLLNHLTLAENIALPLRYHLRPGDPDPEERISALIKLTDLEQWTGRLPAEVSRNWRQRIGLARALALQPQLLLLDNPLTGLDPRDAAWWLDLLDELSIGHPIMDRQPVTLAVTTDDLRPWIERARQFALLKERAFLALGSRADVLDHTEPLLRDLLRGASPKRPSA
jgi:ABC-type transporter Mla maintaining outer membrane lipid asymmetry ATPase subunit MlaF